MSVWFPTGPRGICVSYFPPCQIPRLSRIMTLISRNKLWAADFSARNKSGEGDFGGPLLACLHYFPFLHTAMCPKNLTRRSLDYSSTSHAGLRGKSKSIALCLTTQQFNRGIVGITSCLAISSTATGQGKKRTRWGLWIARGIDVSLIQLLLAPSTISASPSEGKRNWKRWVARSKHEEWAVRIPNWWASG